MIKHKNDRPTIWTRFWKVWRSAGTRGVFSIAWTFFWMKFSEIGYFGRIANGIATWFAPPYKERRRLARYSSRGYIAPSATIHHSDLQLGAHVFIGDRVVIFLDTNGGPVELAERVHLYGDSYLQTGDGGSLKIGSDTHIQPRCQFSAYKAPIQIGCGVQIAPNCAFYPYDHGLAPDRPIKDQPLHTKGGIIIDDDVWLGFGVIVLDGVRIGKGAVVGAGAVVTSDVPGGAIAVGVPARVIASRESSQRVNATENQEYTCKDGSRLPISLTASLIEVEKTAKLICQRLQTLADTVPTQLILQDLLHPLFDRIREVMGTDTVTLLLRAENNPQQLAVQATLGLEEEIAEEIRIPFGSGFAGHIAVSCEPLLVADLSTVEVSSPILRNKGIQSMVGVPLLVKDQMIGVFHIGTLRPRQFTKDDIQLLEVVAERIGSVVDHL